MKSVLHYRSLAACKAFAFTSALAILNAPVAAQTTTEQKLAPVTVSASRFESAEVPIGATVITAEQIRESGIGSVNEAIRKIGGVFGRQNFSGTSDYSLDLRGFGTNSDQNVAIFVDGIRISENELQPAMMSAIPIESVERIEIVRGGSSVLYGEGATGGTIQIITKRGAAKGTRGAIVTEIGSHGYEELRASVAKGWDAFSIDANLGSLRTDNYRDNNELRQSNFNGGVQWASGDTRVGLRIDAAREDFGFPGSLTLSQYEQDPRQTSNPFDKGSLDSNRYTLFAKQQYGNWEAAADLSYREKTSKGTFVSDGYFSNAESSGTQFSPRLKYTSTSGALKNELVAGTDFSSSRRFTTGTYGDQHASQDSAAIYFRDEVRFDKFRVAAGVRHEQFNQEIRDAYDDSFSVNAWDVQGSYAFTSTFSLFAKAGRSYRIANIDENAYLTQPLKPQFSSDLELGSTFGNNNRKLTVKVFRHRLKNEIFYDPNLYANVNLDPTERQGLELEAQTRLSSTVSLSAVVQHVSAEFTEGPYEGRQMVLVPNNIATVRLNWASGNGQTADVGLQWVDRQRNGNDFSNSCQAQIPSFTTVDARYAVKVGTWEFAVVGSNLTGKDYYTYAFGNCGNNRGIYPDAGRSVRLSARMDF